MFSRFEPRIWLMTVIGFFISTGFSISMPFLSLYFYLQRGVPMTVVGAIILAAGICSAIAQMFGGVLADWLGRRPLLIAGTGVSALLYAAMAFLVANSAPVIAIVVIYTLMRSVLTMMRPAITAVVVDVTPKERLTETFGLMRVGQNVGWAAGPAAGGYVAGFLSYAWVFGFAAAISGVTFLVILLLFKESFTGIREKANVRTMLCAGNDRRFFVFTFFSLLVFLVMGQMSSTLSVFTVDRAGFSTVQYGLLLTLNGAIVVFAQYPVTRLTGNIAKPAQLSAGAALYGLGYLAMGWVVGDFPLAMAAMVVITLGEMIFSPTTMAVVGELSPQDWRGHYMGFYGLSETLGMSLGPMLGGFLLDQFPTNPIAIWATISSLAFVAAIGLQRWATRYPGLPPL
ncbi:MAG: MFS transporter [Chloroflexi bacterium]|nr:MFS transporter [Chloroflexota bacterium]